MCTTTTNESLHPAFPESQQFILPSNYMYNDCLHVSLRSSYGDTEIQAVIGAWSFHSGGSLRILFWSQLWLCGFKDEQLLPIQSSVDENKPSKLFVEHQHYVQDWASFPVTQSFSHCIRKNHNTHIVFLGGGKIWKWDPAVLKELIRAFTSVTEHLHSNPFFASFTPQTGMWVSHIPSLWFYHQSTCSLKAGFSFGFYICSGEIAYLISIPNHTVLTLICEMILSVALSDVFLWVFLIEAVEKQSNTDI